MPVIYTGTADIPFQAGKGLRQIEMEKEAYVKGMENAEFELKKQQLEQARIERELERQWREQQSKLAEEQWGKEFGLRERMAFPGGATLPSGYTPRTELGGVRPQATQAQPERVFPYGGETVPVGARARVPAQEIGEGFPTTYRGLPVSGGGVPGAAVREVGEIERPTAATRREYKDYQKQLAKHWWDIKKATITGEKWQAELKYKEQRDIMKAILDSTELSNKQKADQMKRTLEETKFRLEEKKYEEEVPRFEEREEIRRRVRGRAETPEERRTAQERVTIERERRAREEAETPEERRTAQERVTIEREKRARVREREERERTKKEERWEKTSGRIEKRWFDPKGKADANLDEQGRVIIALRDKTDAQRDMDTVNKIYEETDYPYTLRLRFVNRVGLKRDYYVAEYVSAEGAEPGRAEEVAPAAAPEGGRVRVQSPDGARGTIPANELEAALGAGYTRIE